MRLYLHGFLRLQTGCSGPKLLKLDLTRTLFRWRGEVCEDKWLSVGKCPFSELDNCLVPGRALSAWFGRFLKSKRLWKWDCLASLFDFVGSRVLHLKQGYFVSKNLWRSANTCKRTQRNHSSTIRPWFLLGFTPFSILFPSNKKGVQVTLLLLEPWWPKWVFFRKRPGNSSTTLWSWW